MQLRGRDARYPPTHRLRLAPVFGFLEFWEDILFFDGGGTTPKTEGTTVGANSGEAPAAPLSLADYQKQLADKLAASMDKVSADLEAGKDKRKELEDARKAQAEKALAFRKEQKAARASKEKVRDKLKKDIEDQRAKKEAEVYSKQTR